MPEEFKKPGDLSIKPGDRIDLTKIPGQNDKKKSVETFQKKCSDCGNSFRGTEAQNLCGLCKLKNKNP